MHGLDYFSQSQAKKFYELLIDVSEFIGEPILDSDGRSKIDFYDLSFETQAKFYQFLIRLTDILINEKERIKNEKNK